MRPARTARLLLAGCGLLAGCHHAAPARPAATPPVTLPTVARSVARPDVSQVAAVLPTDAPDPGPFLALSPDECRRLAAANSSAARVIAAAVSDPPTGLFAAHAPADDLRKAVAAHLAADARNRTAAAALELYYRLLEAELLTDILAEAIAEVDELVKATDALVKAGFPEPADAPQLRTRQLSARADRETARAGARRLSAELLPLIGADSAAGRVNPTDVLTVPGDTLNPDQAAAVASANRPDVNAARALETGVDTRTVQSAKAAIASLAPGLPVSPPGALVGLLAAFDHDAVDSTRARLTALRIDREKSAAAAARAAATDWQSARAAVGAARRRVELEAEREAQQKLRVGRDKPPDVAARRATLARIEADADVVRTAVRWKLADIALRRELGLLCGG